MAYTATVTSPMKGAERISRSLGIFMGKCDITDYNSTLVEITGITKYFVDIAHTGTQAVKFPKGVISCAPAGASDNGHLFEWNATSGAFKVYKPSGTPSVAIGTSAGGVAVLYDSANTRFQATTAGGSVLIGTAAVASQAADGVDAGEITFIAIGFTR